MNLIRVFPRRTKATPIDKYAYIGEPDLFVEADKVYISVTFSWDIPEAERLFKIWKHYATTEIGGPAIGTIGKEFTPGLFLKDGYVITSRGCPNKCWFCSVWEREGDIRELEIKNGWVVTDDNLLACSDQHIQNVFKMLKGQKNRARFTGGLEAANLRPWVAEELFNLKPQSIFFAYDDLNDYGALGNASKLLNEYPFKLRQKYCYVLCGYPGDSMWRAEARMKEVLGLDMIPFAMLYRNKKGEYEKNWRKFQRSWCRPAAILSKDRK